MRESIPSSAAMAALAAVMAVSACREREALGGGSVPAVELAGEQTGICVSDSLRPATAAPAPGLWLYERRSGERVAAMIGPSRQIDGQLAVARPVETVEVTGPRDTIRHSVLAATVSLELLPRLGASATDGAAADSVGRRHPGATYVVSPRVWLAAYEPCAASRDGPRIRYLRRDAAGRIVTDVLLRRTSE